MTNRLISTTLAVFTIFLTASCDYGKESLFGKQTSTIEVKVAYSDPLTRSAQTGPSLSRVIKMSDGGFIEEYVSDRAYEGPASTRDAQVTTRHPKRIRQTTTFSRQLLPEADRRGASIRKNAGEEALRPHSGHTISLRAALQRHHSPSPEAPLTTVS